MATTNGFSKRMFAKKGMFFPIVGFTAILTLMYVSFGGNFNFNAFKRQQSFSFVKVDGHQFVLDGKPFYVTGWNSYWLMDHASSEKTRMRSKRILEEGAKMGLTVCRSWAFNDGTYHALQVSPGKFDENTFEVRFKLLMIVSVYFFTLVDVNVNSDDCLARE